MIIPLIPALQEQTDNINSLTSTEVKKLGRCFLFDFDTNTFVIKDGKLVECTEVGAVEQWIKLILQTYKDKFNVYKGTDFYCNIEDLVGKKPNGFRLSELKREVTEALLKHRYIQGVDDFEFTNEREKIIVNFTVTLIDGTTLEQEVTV